MAFDTVIRGATLYDGSGGPARSADVGIAGGRIAAIGSLSDAQAGQYLDCTGLALLPGFIDTHTHSDIHLMRDRCRLSALMQGVTTEIVGNCGIGFFPLSRESLEEYVRYSRALCGPLPEGVDFHNADGYLSQADGCGINIAAQVTHGAIRLATAGFRNTPLTGVLMRRAQALLTEAIEQGAVGLSTGLSYYPASYGSDEEVVALAKTVARYGAPLAAHCRTVFPPGSPYNMDTRYIEFIDIARQAGCHIHFSHIKPKPTAAESVDAFLSPFEQAIGDGVPLTMELYPYHFGAGYLLFFVPGWVVEGGYSKTLERLANPVLRSRLTRELREQAGVLGQAVLSHLGEDREYLGMTIQQAASKAGMAPEAFFIELLLRSKLEAGYWSNPNLDADVLTAYEPVYASLLARPYYVVGSDSEPSQTIAHPRTWGAFARILRLAREYRLPLGVVANRLSGLPASIFHLKGRGIIAEGNWADLVLLEPDQVRERCTLINPDTPPEGIRHVFVNGELAILDGMPTGCLAGRGLRRDR